MKLIPYGVRWYEEVYFACLHGEGGEIPPWDREERTPQMDRDAACLKAAEIKPDDRILVCGCGGGNNLMILAEVCPESRRITVLDFAPSAVAYCVRHFPYVTGVIGDVANLPFTDGAFDVLLAMDLTEHLPLPVYAAFLPESSRVLATGGKAVFLPGVTAMPEHINTLSPWQISQHCSRAEFNRVRVNKVWAIVEK